MPATEPPFLRLLTSNVLLYQQTQQKGPFP
jgi:hypothetical protein